MLFCRRFGTIASTMTVGRNCVRGCYRRNMACIAPITLLLLMLLRDAFPLGHVHAHGVLVSPRSRNYVAYQNGTSWQRLRAIPPAEYCYHCLNQNRGLCGRSVTHDYDEWLDSQGQPMPWRSQATYRAGQTVRVRVLITAHHYGHIEMNACPLGRDTTPDCLERYPLQFVRDALHGMPQDLNYPERGYLASSNHRVFEMEFALPADLVGREVLLQVQYSNTTVVDRPRM